MKKNDRNKDRAEIDMTPMIDVVFQLIIFFMLVSEMAQTDLEILDLPSASMATQDPGMEKRVIVNVLAPGQDSACRLKVRGRAMGLRELRRYLHIEAETTREIASPRCSFMPVLIRADREAPYRYAQAVMQACAHPSVRIYKIQMAVKKE